MATLALAVGLVEPALFCLRNHPNEVVYFNALAGGPRGAFGRFDLDYWGNCVYQAQGLAARLAREASMRVVVAGHPWPVVQLNTPRVPETMFARIEDQRHHLEIALVRGQRSDVLAIASRGDILARVMTTDGAVLCTLFPGPAWAELEGRLRVAREAGASNSLGASTPSERQ
jgi:hypothetical protein